MLDLDPFSSAGGAEIEDKSVGGGTSHRCLTLQNMLRNRRFNNCADHRPARTALAQITRAALEQII